MSHEFLQMWPLRPSHSAEVAHGLCMALADLLAEEGGGDVSRRAYLKMYSLVVAAELMTREVSHWFGSRMGEAADQLDALEDEYVEEQAKAWCVGEN